MSFIESIRKHPIGMYISILIVAVGTVIAIKLAVGEPQARNRAICEAQNATRSQVLKYVKGLAEGAATRAAPLPEDLPASVARFVAASRLASREYNAQAYADAQKKFRQVPC